MLLKQRLQHFRNYFLVQSSAFTLTHNCIVLSFYVAKIVLFVEKSKYNFGFSLSSLYFCTHESKDTHYGSQWFHRFLYR